MEAVGAIALNTFKEILRDKIIYAFFLFACLISVLGLLLGTLSVGQDLRIVENIGLAAIALIGGAIAVFSGANLVYKELERKTIYLIFSKPVDSWQFVLGKYLGISACLLIIVLMMGGFLGALLGLVDPNFVLLDGASSSLLSLFYAICLIYVELLFIIAAACFFSTFATPMMSVIFTLCFWVVGHSCQSLQELAKMSQNPLLAKIINLIYWLLPDLAGLTRIRSLLMYEKAPDLEMLTFLTSYIFAYIVLLIVLSAVINERRELP